MKNIDENAIIQRIRLLRTQYAGSRGKSKFARALGISPSTYSYYEDKRVPPIETLLNICDVTGASIEWLLCGTSGEKGHKWLPNSTLLRKLEAVLSKNPSMITPISAFLEMLDEKQDFEKQLFAQSEQNSTIDSPAVTEKADRPGWIPILGRTAAGMVHFWKDEVLPEPGAAVTELEELVREHLGREIVDRREGEVSMDIRNRPLTAGLDRAQVNLIQINGGDADGIVEFIECKQVFEKFPDSFALLVDGDSMSPKINDGDIVILSPSVPAAEGQMAVARVAEQIGVTCKLIRTTDSKVHLIPVNERYETKVVEKDKLLWALAVLCHVRL